MGTYDITWPALTLLVGAIAWVAGSRLRRGALLSPYSLILLILISIFGFRPLLMPSEPASFDFYGYNISGGYGVATVIGFLGTVAFVVGHTVRQILLNRRGREPAWQTHRLPAVRPDQSVLVAWLILLLWLLTMIVIGGGPGFLTVLFAGRSAAVDTVLAGVPAIVPALPVVACLMPAVVRFKWERIQCYTARQNLAYWIVAIAAIVPPSALGTRRFLIPSVMIMVVGALARSWNRKVPLRWFVTGVVAFLILAIVPFVRSAGSRVGGRTDLLGAMGVYFRDEGTQGTLDNFFLSYDTEMFNWVAYFAPRMGEAVPYGLGRGTVGELLASPLPASLSPVERWNDTLLTYAFGADCASGDVCPVPSIVGILFTDLSWVGLVFGMAILGALCANFEGSLLRSSSSYTAVLLLVAGFAILFARGNSLAQAWIAVQVFVVWWIAYQIVATLSTPQRRASPPQPVSQYPNAMTR